MCCRMRILRTKHSRRIEKTIDHSCFALNILPCVSSHRLPCLYQGGHSWLEFGGDWGHRSTCFIGCTCRYGNPKSWKTFGSSFAQLCRQSSSITTSVPLSSKGLLRPCAMQICFAGSPLCAQRHAKRMENSCCFFCLFSQDVCPNFLDFDLTCWMLCADTHDAHSYTF